VDRFSEGVGDFQERADETIDDGRRTLDRATQTVEDTRNRGRNLVDDARETVDDGVEQVSRDVGEFQERADRTIEGGRETLDRATQTVEQTRNRGRQALDDATAAASSAKGAADSVADDIVGDAEEFQQDLTESVNQRRTQPSDRVQGFANGDPDVFQDPSSGSSGSSGLRDTVDQGIRDVSGGELRLSDDFTSTDDWFDNAQFNDDLANDLTTGGVMSEDQEKWWQDRAEWVDGYKDNFDNREDITIAGSDAPERALEGAAGAGVDLLNVPQHVLTAETALEIGQNTPGAISEYGASSYAQTASLTGAAVGNSMVQDAKSDPVGFVSGLGLEAVAGAGIGRAASQSAKAARTLGKTKVDADQVTNPDTVDYYNNAGGDQSDRFPGFRPQDGETPAEAFRRQGEEFTPEQVQAELGETRETETYATHGTNFDFGSEFEAGIEKSRPSDPDNAMFVGPEFSPGFAGIEAGGSGGLSSLSSLRPRLPRVEDFRGGDQQMIVSRMNVDEVPESVGDEAATGGSPMAPGDESRFLAEDADQGNAYVRNSQNRNLGEAEALVPGGTTFREVSDSNLYTEIGGETVDIRLFETPDAQRPLEADLDASQSNLGGSQSGLGFDEGGLYTADNLPSSGRTTPQGTPTAPTFTGGYGGGSAGAGGSGGAGPGVGPMDLDETGLSPESGPSSTTSPPSSRPNTPSSRGSGSPSSTGSSIGPGYSGSPIGSNPTSPPASPPGSTGSPGSSGSPGSAGSPGNGLGPSYAMSPVGSGFTASPFDPVQSGTRPRIDMDQEPRREDEDLDQIQPWDVGFSNPIASGASVLFGSVAGGFGGPDMGNVDGIESDLGKAQEEISNQFDWTGTDR